LQLPLQILPGLLHQLLAGLAQVEDQRTHFSSTLATRTHVRKIILKSYLTLDTAVSNLADFVRIELLPFLVVELPEKIEYVHRINKIDESVAHIAAILKVDGQVEEIVLVLRAPVNGLQQHVLGVLIRDVLYHD